MFRSDPMNIWTQELLPRRKEETNAFCELWITLAQEYLANVEAQLGSVIPIAYNKWAAEAEYRASLCRRFEVPVNDSVHESVPIYGFGSSFDGMKFDGAASSMKVTDRWRECVNDPQFRLVLEGQTQMHALSRQIFGDIVGGDKELPDWLERDIDSSKSQI